MFKPFITYHLAVRNLGILPNLKKKEKELIDFYNNR